MFYALSTNEEFMAKHISVFVALAPCAKIKNPNKSTCFIANNFYWFVDSISDVFGVQEIKHASLYVESLKYSVCDYLKHFKRVLPEICDWNMTKEEARIRNEVLNGSGTSIKNIKHLS